MHCLRTIGQAESLFRQVLLDIDRDGPYPSLFTLMPAINLPRLRIQSAALMEKYGDPDGFLRELHNLFDSYTDRLLRSRAIVSPVSILPSYRIPPAVMRHVELELSGKVQADPDHALSLADKLWEDGYLESRLLAAFLLGRILPHGDAFMDRLTTWVADTRDPALSNSLLSTSLARLRAEATEDFLKLVGNWARPSHKKMWSSAINALLPLLRDKNFHNLPAIFKIVQPILESAPATMQKDLANLVNALYAISPVETTFFLRQVVTLSTGTHIVQNIRRILPALPKPLQEVLRESIR